MKKTLVTLSMIKVALDHHPNINNFLDIYVPLVANLIKKKNITNFNQIEQICTDFIEEYGLIIPHHPMLAIINRLKQLHYFFEIKENYFSLDVDKFNSTDFTITVNTQEYQFNRIIEKYKNFAKDKHGITIDNSTAVDHLIALLNDHDIDMMFINDRKSSILPLVKTTEIDINLVYDYVRFLFENDIEIFSLFSDISFGHIIASTLLFNYENSISIKKRCINYYLDIGILFGLVGINGEYEKKVFEDFIHLLINSGGNIFIFNHSYEEFINIIDACKLWIDNPNYDPIKANRSLANFKSRGYHISDIDIFIEKIPKLLVQYNLQKCDTPDPGANNEHQISDENLQKQIIDVYKKNNPFFDEDEKEETIYLDVKSISAVHKLRNGIIPRNINECDYIFVTRNSTLAYATKLFEASLDISGRFFIPSTVTDVFIGTIIWLNSPNASNLNEINQKRLIANCYAALSPTKSLRGLFLAEVEKSAKDSTLSEDEVYLLKTSSVAQELLQERTLGDPKKITGRTPIEIIEEIKTRERLSAKRELEVERIEYTKKVITAESIIKDKQKEIDIKNEEIEAVKGTLNQVISEKKNIIDAVRTRVYKNSNTNAWIIFVVLLLVLIFLFTFQEFGIQISIDNTIIQALKFFVSILNIISITFNINLLKVKEKIFRKLIIKELKSYKIEIEDQEIL
jgi:hypothetical protein